MNEADRWNAKIKASRDSHVNVHDYSCVTAMYYSYEELYFQNMLKLLQMSDSFRAECNAGLVVTRR